MRSAALLAFTLMLAACGGGGGGGGSGGGGGGGSNSAPTFTSASSVSIAENTAGAIYTATATDPESNPLTFSIAGGADAARFSMAGAALSFVTAPDFELAGDANADSVYNVTLRVSDGTNAVTLPLTVTVTNVAGAPAVRRVATGASQPIFLAPYSGARVLVIERAGLIRILDTVTGAYAATPFLNVTAETTTTGERGLLGLALAPDFATSRTFYIYMTNTAGNIELRRYRTQTANPDAADTSTADLILTIPHPGQANHNGGWMAFGPDGFLYVATGDGGGAGDPNLNGQNAAALLGKILRIDPSSDAFPADNNRDYAIPAGNPFASGGGAAEIWVLGMRNPWRNSFDRSTGNLIVADVGQGAWEEIDLVRSSDGGRNYGWNIMEGNHAFAGGSTAGLTPPVAEYAHGTGQFQGNSITGGYVYRGPVTALQGVYFFADFINPRLWSIPVSSFVQGTTLSTASFTDRTTSFAPNAGAYSSLASFGEDVRGNVFIIDIDGEIFVITEAD